MVDVFTEYAWVKCLKDKKAKTILYSTFEIINEYKPKLNKVLADQEREFYNGLMQKWLDE